MPEILDDQSEDHVLVALKKLNKRLKEMSSKEIVALFDALRMVFF